MSSSWSPVAKSFHWLVALLIFVAAMLGWVSHEAALSPGKLQLYIWHKSFGLTVLGLMILRLVWRLTQQSPVGVEGLSEQNHKLANLGHFAVYLFALLMPLSGWILNSAANYPFKWFGFFEVPMLIYPSAAIQASASTVHLVFFWILTILVVGHVVMACKHHLAGIPLLRRMLPARVGILPMLAMLWFATVALFGLAYTSSFQITKQVSSDVAKNAAGSSSVIASTGVDKRELAPAWQMLEDESALTFTGTYDEIEFLGGFSEFSPELYFDPQDPSKSFLDVTIDVTSVATDSYDRDAEMPSKMWFWFSEYSESKYIASEFLKLDDGRYQANGVLDLKGVKKVVPLVFSWAENDQGRYRLLGEASLDRRDFGFGNGPWLDDPTVGFEIKINVDLLLAPA